MVFAELYPRFVEIILAPVYPRIRPTLHCALGKKGQIYILAAILLAIIIYGLSTIPNIIEQEEIKGDFSSLAKNYETESSKLINSVSYSGGNVTDSFINFTFLFTSYSKGKSPDFNLFYALSQQSELHFGNFMNEKLEVFPCVTSGCPSDTYMRLEGCLANVSSQISFEGLTVETSFWKTDFEFLKSKCTGMKEITTDEGYCVNIGGVVYNLTIEKNVPRIFSLSRLKSGGQVLQSALGDIGQEQVCRGTTESACCEDFCCWDDKDEVCREGLCKGKECPNGICESGESCSSCPQDCSCCADGTPYGRCSTTKPKYCEGGSLKDECDQCGCPVPGQQECQSDGTCCIKGGKPCDGSVPCCSGQYCDLTGDRKCKEIS